MKSSTKSRQPKVATDPNRAAVLSIVTANGVVEGCQAVCVVTSNDRPELVDTESFTGATALEDARSWIERHLAARTVIMLAGCDVICRTVTMPSATNDQLEMALRLQVENLLLGGAAPWRTNASLVPTSDPDRARSALLVEWAVANAAPALSTNFVASLQPTFAPPVAALAALIGGALKLGAHEAFTVYLERNSGSISIAYSDGIHSAFRTSREDGSDVDEWKASVVRITGETLLLADIPEAAIDPLIGALRTTLENQSDGLIAPLTGELATFESLAKNAPSDEQWWGRNGILLGTAIALCGPLSGVCSLQARAPEADVAVLARLVAAARKPKIAARLVIAAIMLAAVVPPALSGARLAYLQWLLPEAEAYERALLHSDQLTSMFREYEKYAWPMSKLLGDIASTTPEGIELESISISHGSPVKLEGSAKPQGGNGAAEAILLMERQMRESRVFDRIEKNWDAPNANGVIKFNMSASVANATLVPNYSETQDFARRTLRDRRYGVVEPAATATRAPTVDVVANESDSSEGSLATAVASTQSPGAQPATELGSEGAAAAIETVQAARDDPRAIKRRGSSAGSAAPDAARRGDGSSQSAGAVIPDPLTDQQIASMTPTEAREALGKVSRARGGVGISEADEARLKAEFYKLLDQARGK